MTLPCERWGSGETRVVFLHGFTGNRASFRHLEPLMGEAVSATCIELPGHGEAPLPTDWHDAVEAIAQTVGERAVIIGYSQGARLALALALRYPQLVDRLVLESGSPGLRRRHERTLRRVADEALARTLTDDGVDAFIARWEQHPLFAGLRALPAEERARLHARRSSHSAQGLAEALRCLGQGAQPDYWGSLTKLLRPTLLITGARDAKYTRLARRMAAELPLGWWVTVSDVGHAPHLESPATWAAEVRSFLAPAWNSEPMECAP